MSTNYLIGISGTQKGHVWPIDAAGLGIGRDSSSDIQLLDPVVSRNQCRVYLENDKVLLQDMGSLNPALVNGRPEAQVTLQSGDMIAVGRHQFLVATVAPAQDPDKPTIVSEDDTAAWDKASPILLRLEDFHKNTVLRPGNIQDLIYLYEVTRELGEQISRTQMLEALERRIREKYRPAEYRMAFFVGGETISFYGREQKVHGQDDALFDEIAKKSLDQQHGILQPGTRTDAKGRVRLFTLAAPLIMGDVKMGAILVQTYSPLGIYDEEDLKLLVLLAQLVAPILYSIETFEVLQQDNARLRALSGASETLLGTSKEMRLVRGHINKAAKTNLSVLITGDTGTGKELVARMVHARSKLSTKPYIIVNCAAIPEELFEAELFGSHKGAYTGARDRSGLCADAHGGTMFLDEIGDLSMENQARILRLLETGTFRRLGSTEEIRVTIRFISATNKDLDEAVEKDLFRRDLFHRIAQYRIHVPTLNEHLRDIPELALHFLGLAREWVKHPVVGISPEALEHLQTRNWRGNVRELRNCILRAAANAGSDVLQLRDFSDMEVPVVYDPDAPVLSLAEMERRHIVSVIDKCKGNLKAAAESLGVARSTLYNKITEYNIR